MCVELFIGAFWVWLALCAVTIVGRFVAEFLKDCAEAGKEAGERSRANRVAAREAQTREEEARRQNQAEAERLRQAELAARACQLEYHLEQARQIASQSKAGEVEELLRQMAEAARRGGKQ